MAMYMLLQSTPPYRLLFIQKITKIVEKVVLFFQDKLFPTLKLLVSLSNRKTEYGMFAKIPREISAVIVLFLFKDFTNYAENTVSVAEAFQFFGSLVSQDSNQQ